MRGRWVQLGALVLGLHASAAAAQDSARVILPGTRVRLTLADGSTIVGRADSTTPAVFGVTFDAGSRAVALTDVRAVELRQSRTGRWALYFGAGGVVMGAIGGFVLPQVFCNRQSGECEGDPAGGVAIVTIPAAILGAFTGSFLEDWRPQPHGVSVARGPAMASLTAARGCRAPGGTHASIGTVFGGGLAASGGIVFMCREQRTMGLEVGYSDLPDEPLYRFDEPEPVSTTTRSAGHISLVAERTVVGKLRALASIDADQYNWVVRSTGSQFAAPGRRRGIGVSGGLAAGLPIGGRFAVRGEVRGRVATLWGSMASAVIGIERAR